MPQVTRRRYFLSVVSCGRLNRLTGYLPDYIGLKYHGKDPAQYHSDKQG